MYSAYVLISDEGFHYTGSSKDAEIRLEKHLAKTTRYTKKGKNWRIVYKKEFPTRAEAMKYEKWLKSGVGREWLKKNVAGWSPPQAE